MSDLKDFLQDTADDATPLGSVSLALGADLPFCLLRLRAFHPEGDENRDLSITRRTHGTRALMLSGETHEYGDATPPNHIFARLPTLLRVAARPRDYGSAGAANALHLWQPGTSPSVTARIAQSDEAQDLLAVPEPFEDLTGADAAYLPTLRLVEGSAQLKLELGNGTNALAKFLRFDPAKNTIFDGVTINNVSTSKSGERYWQVEATPQGLTFTATLADPTSGLRSDPVDDLHVNLRLEADKSRDSYRLRLIERASDAPEGTLKGVRERLQQIVTDLIATKAPQRYRINLRDAAPPLVWPLEHSEGQLSVIPVPADHAFVLAEIDRSHVDLRLITTARGVGEGSAQARVELARVELHSTARSFELHAYAGGAVADASYRLNFARNGDGWSQQLVGTFGHKRVRLPAESLRERLTQRYRDAGLIEAETAPYAFFALRDGWMQVPLPEGTTDETAAVARARDDGAKTANALTGRLLFEASDTADKNALPRVLELSSAEGLRITTTWGSAGTRGLKEFAVEATGEAGTIYGFLFVADKSPTAFEAVPDWTRGSASVREVPLGFDSTPNGDITFQWASQDDTSDWELSFSLPTDPVDSDTLAWVTMENAPFITNYPMSRSAKSAPIPSRSRGLFPRALSGIVRMHFQIKSGEAVENDLPVLLGVDATSTAPGTPFGPAPQDPVGLRFMQSALLPTLHGVEFKPDPAAADWQFTVALRYDYPVLDELFAWSDLPPVEPENTQTAQANEPDALVVTALPPDRLATLWRDAEQRMQLTWTQDAVIANNLAVNTAHEIELDTLAYPHAYEQRIAVTLSRQTLFGDLTYDDDWHGQRGGLDQAAVGLGGVLSDTDDGLTLSSTKDDPHVHVTGYGIDQYVPTKIASWDTEAQNHLSDARGTSMRTRATRNGTLRALRHYGRDGDNVAIKEVHLHTMPTPEWFSMEIAGNMTDVNFQVRDLPLDPRTNVFTGMRPFADSYEASAPNSIESYRSNTGRTLDRENFGQSLFEWRCYPQRTSDGVLGVFEIPIGPFRFRPLRLIQASFNTPVSDNSAPLELKGADIVGGLSFRKDGQDSEHSDFAFGADRIYDRDDLFIFRSEGSPRWQGAAVAKGQTDDEVTWQDRAPTLTFTRRLPIKDVGDSAWFTSDEGVDAQITLGFDHTGADLTPQTATMRARLFGRDHTVTDGTVEISDDDVLNVTFGTGARWDPPLPAALRDIKMVATCTASGHNQCLAIDGKVDVLAQGDTGVALFRLQRGAVRWLDLDLPDAGLVPKVDHEAGVLSCAVPTKGKDINGGVAPLFGLPLGAPGAKAELSISLTEVLETEGDGRVLHFLADLRVGDGAQFRLNHEVLSGTGDIKTDINRLRLTWQSDESLSPIQWRTLEGISLDTGPNLSQIAGGSLTPPAYENSGAPSRLLTLDAEPVSLTHHIAFHLNDFYIDPATLTLHDTRVLPLNETLRGLAQVKHTLSDGKDEKTWWSCDFIALATAPAMQSEAGVLADGRPQTAKGTAISFVPRQNHRIKTNHASDALEYRGDPEHIGSDHLPEGTARLENANLSGWHDPGMTKHLWNDLDASVVFFVAIAPLWMEKVADPSANQIKLRAHQINLPWAYGLPTDTMLQTAPPAGTDTYRIPTMETWAAHPLASTGAGAVVALNTQMREVEMLAALTDGKSRQPDLRAMLPATTGLFEPWKNGNPSQVETFTQHKRAPYFLRAMLALAAHWSKANIAAPVMSLVPDTIWQSDAQPTDPPHQTHARRALMHDKTALLAPREKAAVPVDLVILAPSGAIVAPSYRQMQTETNDWAKPAELFDAAHRLVEDARFALFRVNAKGLAVGRSVARPRDPLYQPGAALRPNSSDILASPALGWPMDSGTVPDTPLAPGFEAEHALQSPIAGFAGRSQRTLWPAVATAASDKADPDTAVESLGLRFSEHVVFDRGPAPFPHDGPAARHLAPAMARRRAPLPFANIPKDASEELLWAPIMPPVVDRLVIGRRPGVLDTCTASATLVRKLNRPALDSGWPGTGQPASAGPVIGAQMRNPRSPLLPLHPGLQALFDGQSSANETLRLSRRTYLSRADGPLDKEPLKHFVHHHYLSDTTRITDRDGNEWRLSTSGPFENVTLPSTQWWAGRINLILEAKSIDLHGKRAGTVNNIRKLFGVDDDTDIEDRISAQLFIGQQNWRFADISGSINDGSLEIGIGVRSQRATDFDTKNLLAINDLLRQADADTPLHLELAFSHTDGIDQSNIDFPELPRAGLARFKVPLLLGPRGSRSIPVAAETLNFGDPSYDRALGSPTLTKPLSQGSTRMMIALDRQQANPDTQMHIAFDDLDEETGGFKFSAGKTLIPLKLAFKRIPFRSGDEPEKPDDQDLILANPSGRPARYANLIFKGKAAILNLADLFVPEFESAGSPLRSGDTLRITCRLERNDTLLAEAALDLPIVAGPVIPPAPSVYSFIEEIKTSNWSDDPKAVRVRLHASAPLPTRIDYPDLFGDMGRGHVRRQGLFVWHYGLPEPARSPLKRIQHLLKVDRSGGTQLPENKPKEDT